MLHFLKATLKEKDQARRQFILNVLLFCTSLLSFVAFFVALVQDYILHIHRDGNSSVSLFVLFLIFFLSFIASRYGKIKITAYFFISFYVILISHAIYQWGPDMPIGLLVYALLIVMSGILINSKFAFIITGIISFYITVLIYLNINRIVIPEHNWKTENVEVVDGIIFIAIFLVIATVSWLFNRETEKALRRARYSEAALQKERDSLAAKVEEKTKELRQEQADRIMQLYKFAEFGKSTSEFLHDLSNSVNLVSANLKQLENKNDLKDMKEIVSRARVGTKRLEGFLLATRKQINNQDFSENFSVNDEIEQAIEIINYKAKKSSVVINFHPEVKIKTYGNPMKFHQLICNLLSNGVDAYETSHKKNKTLDVLLAVRGKMIKIQVIDYGKGITKNHIKQIFQPFFTTKEFNKGTGIGLSISHDIVTQNFKGTISVESAPGLGSTFTVVIPQRTKI